MSLSNDHINININEIEEGELSETNINNQEILKLIEDKRKEINEKTQQNSIFQTKNDYLQNDMNEEGNESDNNDIGFFHKMNQPNNSSYLKKKKKNDLNGEILKDENNSPQNKLKFNNNKRPNFQQRKGRNDQGNLNNKLNFNRKRLICNYYINGACHKGNDCTFSHDAPQVKKPNELCKFFLTGNCSKGDDCLYSHNTSNFPCKYFHAVGFCEKGTECRFSHSRLTDDDIKTFIETNEEFMNELYRHNGTSNMNDYYFQYIKEKKSQNIKEYLENLKVPSTAMLPPTTSLLNINQLPNSYMSRTVTNMGNNQGLNPNQMMKNVPPNLINSPYFPNMIRAPIMMQPIQMQNFLMKNNMNIATNPMMKMPPFLGNMNTMQNQLPMKYVTGNQMGNFLQKINPFEMMPKTNSTENIEKPSIEEETGNNSKNKPDDNSFEEVIEEPEKQESFFNPSVVDAKEIVPANNTNKNNTIENLTKVLKIVEILKKNPLDNSNANEESKAETKTEASTVRKDPRLKKKN